jgi:HEAT repeat protein
MKSQPRRSLRPLALILAVALPSIALGAKGDDMYAEVRTFLAGGDDDDSAGRLLVSTPVRETSEPIDFPRQAAAIRAALDDAPTVGARAELIDRLGIVGDRSDVDLLLEHSESANSRVAMSAMNALGRLGGRRAIDRLATFARSNDATINMTATGALGLSSDSEAVTVLEELAEHPDQWRRQTALTALALRGGARARRVIHRAYRRAMPTDAWTVATAVATLGEAPDRRLLVASATNPHDPRADAAMWALATLAGPETDDLLIELAETATGMRKASALGALAGVRDPRAVEVLLAAWDDGNQHRYTVLSTLGQSKAPGALDALLELLDRARPDQAMWVVDALATRPEQTAREVLLVLATEEGQLAQYALGAPSPDRTSRAPRSCCWPASTRRGGCRRPRRSPTWRCTAATRAGRCSKRCSPRATAPTATASSGRCRRGATSTRRTACWTWSAPATTGPSAPRWARSKAWASTPGRGCARSCCSSWSRASRRASTSWPRPWAASAATRCAT